MSNLQDWFILSTDDTSTENNAPFMIVTNSSYAAMPFVETMGQYILHSIVTFEEISQDEDEVDSWRLYLLWQYINHFMCIGFGPDGYYIYDDLLILPHGGFQVYYLALYWRSRADLSPILPVIIWLISKDSSSMFLSWFIEEKTWRFKKSRGICEFLYRALIKIHHQLFYLHRPKTRLCSAAPAVLCAKSIFIDIPVGRFDFETWTTGNRFCQVVDHGSKNIVKIAFDFSWKRIKRSRDFRVGGQEKAITE